VVVKDGINILFGEAKVGKKSFTGISMGCAVATGREWAKAFATEKMSVLYVAAEGFHGLLRRQAAWEKLNGATCGDSLQFFKVPINLFNQIDITAALIALEAQGFKPGFVVIDTLQRSMSGGSENDTEDMSKVFELAELLRSELGGATILIIHHTRKDGLNYRGSSVISGAADGLIQAVSKDLMITISCHGFKDARS
jgi:RecA-family ATPase